MPVAAREMQATLVEDPHDFGYRAELQEHLEHKFETSLNRQIGVFDHHVGRVAQQADRQRERKLATLGLGEQACGQPAADSMKFEFRYRSLQTEEQTPIGACRVVDAISI